MSKSNVAISFETLFNILPKGILSKNSVIGAYSKLIIIFLWIISDVLITFFQTNKDRKNAKKPNENTKIEYIFKYSSYFS